MRTANLLTTIQLLPLHWLRCDIDPNTKYSASKLYEADRHFCQAIGRKPQSTNAFKKALDKITNVYQSRTSSGMQWHGIQPVMQF